MNPDPRDNGHSAPLIVAVELRRIASDYEDFAVGQRVELANTLWDCATGLRARADELDPQVGPKSRGFSGGLR